MSKNRKGKMTNKQWLSLLILIIIAFFAKGQEVKIIDKTTLQPIENVCLFTQEKNRTAITNKHGIAKLSDFKENDEIIVRHPFFKIIQISLKDIKAQNNIIKLDETAIKLDEVVISTTKWKQLKKEVPNKIVSISEKKIQFENPQTTADLLNTSNEVFVQKSQMGGGSPMIRGFASNSVLLVIDGVRMNNAIYRSGNLQNVITLDPNVIENTEVIFGTGSIIYGSDALGGVMNFRTKKAKLASNGKNVLKTNALLRYSTANHENTIHVDFNYGTKKFSTLTSISYSNFDDLKTGSKRKSKYSEFGKRTEYVDFINGKDTIIKNEDENLQVYSGYHQLNLMQKFRFKPSKYLDLNYAFHYSTSSDIPRYDRLTQYKDGSLKYAEWYYGPQKWMMNSLNIKYSKKNIIFDDVKMIIAIQDIEESRCDRTFQQTDLRIRTENVNVYTANFDFDKRINKKSSIYYGLEAVYNTVNSNAVKKNIYSGESVATASRYPDGGSYTQAYSAYSNLKTNISKHFTLLSGVRYSYMTLYGKIDDNSFYNFPFTEIELNPSSAFNGSLGLVYRPNEEWQLNYNLSSGFRAPNVDDVAKVFDSEPGNVIVPNKNLKPENVYNVDFGVIKKINKIAKIEGSVFYTYLIDAMVRRDFRIDGKDSIMYDGEMSKVQAVQNAGEAFIVGGSITITAELSKHFVFTSHLTYTKGKDITENIPIRHVPPFFGSTRISYKTNSLRIDFYSNYNGSKDFKDMSPSEQSKDYLYASDGSTPAWLTLNLKGSYQLNQKIQFNLGLENILDVHYRPYSSGISAPGRNISFAIRATI
ncbi:MAG: TonB-dependent receptor [Bacteroidota bacterium]|nr:TonB-dependent receptor [Bacteroidota bacterium]